MNLSIPIVVELCAFSPVAMHAPANIAFIDFRDAKKFAQNVELRSNRLLFYSIRAPFHKYCQLQFIIIHYALLNNRKLSINKNIINSARLRSCLYILTSTILWSQPYGDCGQQALWITAFSVFGIWRNSSKSRSPWWYTYIEVKTPVTPLQLFSWAHSIFEKNNF